jgi:hypothetical protein
MCDTRVRKKKYETTTIPIVIDLMTLAQIIISFEGHAAFGTFYMDTFV